MPFQAPKRPGSKCAGGSGGRGDAATLEAGGWGTGEGEREKGGELTEPIVVVTI